MVPPDVAADGMHWQPRWAAAALCLMALLGLSGWLVGGHGALLGQVAWLLAVHSICLALIPLLGPPTLVFSALYGLAMLPMVARLVAGNLPYQWYLASVLAVVFGLSALVARRHWRTQEQALELRLAQQARVQRLELDAAQARQAVSDAEHGLAATEQSLLLARRALHESVVECRMAQAQVNEAQAQRRTAERASAAKTQFLAAASHDLRQPLHALGLFVQTLRSRHPAPPGLVDNIGEAVIALDDLFTELLDITRIDAGAVDVRAADFVIEPLWRRLRLHFEPVAFDKGLVLTLRGGHHVAHGDALLVERILRNLTANALRYTADGGVLVAARRRRDRLLLQVWDSGMGIAAGDQGRVFDEFVRITDASTDPATIAAQRGMGLGLAIVKRLAKLMGTTVELRSIPGRGSVFSLTLPLGSVQPNEPGESMDRARPAGAFGAYPMSGATSASGALGLGPTLHGRRIVVLDADATVRQTLSAWLGSWGAAVEAFDSFEACQRWAGDPIQPQSASASATVDLWLVGWPAATWAQATPPQASPDLDAYFGAGLPVLWLGDAPVSGNTLDQPTRHVLDKPIQPNRLRAMISFILGSASKY